MAVNKCQTNEKEEKDLRRSLSSSVMASLERAQAVA